MRQYKGRPEPDPPMLAPPMFDSDAQSISSNASSHISIATVRSKEGSP